MLLTLMFSFISAAEPAFLKTPPPLLASVRNARVEPEDEHFPERYFWGRQPIMPAQGLMLSYGFERGYIAAAASPNTTGLLSLEDDPETLSHFRLNAYLLAVQDFEDYSRFRTRREESAECFAMRMILERDEVESFNLCSERLAIRFFRRLDPQMNYWKNPGRFQRLAQMAKQERIIGQPIRFFSSGEPLRKLVDQLHKDGEVIASVLLGAGVRLLLHNEGLDQGLRSLRSFLKVLEPVLDPKALALYTHPVKNAVDPYYETVEITKLVKLNDRDLADFFLSDCEVDLSGGV